MHKNFKFLFVTTLLSYQALASTLQETKIVFQKGFAKIPYVSESNIHKFRISEKLKKKKISSLCKKVQSVYKKYGWKESACGQTNWQTDYESLQKNPLIYSTFGSGKNTTLFLGGVHPDELTPMHLAFKLASYLTKNPSAYQTRDVKIIIAPLVSPDGLFTKKRILRTNGVVDVNRNFITHDWYEKSLSAWKNRRKSRSRYFPGYFPNTEIETIFQTELIAVHKPDKILSVHAPLGFLDYDGPADQQTRNLSKTEKKARLFVHSIAKKSRNYRVVNYRFYPGSLGNYAGNERDIPTVTLELPTTNPAKTGEYWQKFWPGFSQSINYPFLKVKKG